MKNISNIVFMFFFLFNFNFNARCQTDANIPCHGITIYIDYPDVPASVTAIQLDSLINGVNYQEPGIQRSFRKYWYGQTRRNIVMQHDIFFYTAPLPSTYYKTLSWQNGILLWKDALEWVITNNPTYNWSALTLNMNLNGGGLRSVMIISSAWGPTGVGGAHGPSWILSNGVLISRIYGMVLKAPWDTNNNMFMTLHESGHAIFGFPDTYDTDNSGSGGTSFYCLMSGGAPDVEPIGGPFQVSENWGHILEPAPGKQTITLRADGDSLVVFRNLHDPLEFFTIEARKQSNIGNSRFPANLGLLIWHSDTKVNTSNTLEDRTPMKHYEHSIVQADGLFELEGYTTGGNIGDIFLPGNSFSNITLPNTKWWDDSASYIAINNIQLIGTNQIRFDVTVPNAHADHYPQIPQNGWSLVSATNSQTGYDGTKAFDGNPTTYFHVPWGNTIPRPHEIVINLGQNYTINEFFYTANKNDLPPWEGRVENYELFISLDTLNWGAPVVSRTFFETGIMQYARFAEKTGRYLKFSAKTSFNNDMRTSIAELNIRGFNKPLPQFASSAVKICAGTQITYTDQTTNGVTSWKWTFPGGTPATSTAQNPTVTYNATGTYDVKLVSQNALAKDSIIKSNHITVNAIPVNPSTTGAGRCGAGIVNLSATGSGTLEWYTASTGGILVYTGTGYSPTLSTTTSYYVSTSNAPAPQKVGPVDTTFGSGVNFTANNVHGLLFNVLAPCRLKTVKVYAGTAGNRTVELLSGIGGTVLLSKVVNIPAGESRITLDFDLIMANQQFLKISGTFVDLKRTAGGASYPYNLAGLVSITESDVASTVPGYYYFFYDWEITQFGCSSNRIPVAGTINAIPPTPTITQNGAVLTSSATSGNQWYFNGALIPGAISQTYTATTNGNYTVVVIIGGCSSTESMPLNYINTGIVQTDNAYLFTIYPNPTNGNLHVAFNTDTKTDYKLELRNILGQIIYKEALADFTGAYSKQLNIAEYGKGIYMISLTNSKSETVKKIIVY